MSCWFVDCFRRIKEMYSEAFLRIWALLDLSPCGWELFETTNVTCFRLVSYLHRWDGVSQSSEAVLDVITSLSLKSIVVCSTVERHVTVSRILSGKKGKIHLGTHDDCNLFMSWSKCVFDRVGTYHGGHEQPCRLPFQQLRKSSKRLVCCQVTKKSRKRCLVWLVFLQYLLRSPFSSSSDSTSTSRSSSLNMVGGLRSSQSWTLSWSLRDSEMVTHTHTDTRQKQRKKFSVARKQFAIWHSASRNILIWIIKIK